MTVDNGRGRYDKEQVSRAGDARISLHLPPRATSHLGHQDIYMCVAGPPAPAQSIPVLPLPVYFSFFYKRANYFLFNIYRDLDLGTRIAPMWELFIVLATSFCVLNNKHSRKRV